MSRGRKSGGQDASAETHVQDTEVLPIAAENKAAVALIKNVAYELVPFRLRQPGYVDDLKVRAVVLVWSTVQWAEGKRGSWDSGRAWQCCPFFHFKGQDRLLRGAV